MVYLIERWSKSGISEDGDSGNLLSPGFVLDSDDGDLKDRGVAQEGAFDIQRAYFVATGPATHQMSRMNEGIVKLKVKFP